MKIALILMASGFGRRFGGHKLETLVDGRPLYTYGMKLCQAAQAFLPCSGIDCQVTVVTAHAGHCLGLPGSGHSRRVERPGR